MSANGGALRVNGERLWARLMAMGRIGATPSGGCNRQALTDLDIEGRRLLCTWAEAAGCAARVDVIGNLFLRRTGYHDELPVVLLGSHLDTQPTGGRFDGVFGVLAGLEVIETLNDHGITTPLNSPSGATRKAVGSRCRSWGPAYGPGRCRWHRPME